MDRAVGVELPLDRQNADFGRVPFLTSRIDVLRDTPMIAATSSTAKGRRMDLGRSERVKYSEDMMQPFEPVQ